MLELWEIKEQVYKELAGKSFEEVKKILDESSRRRGARPCAPAIY